MVFICLQLPILLLINYSDDLEIGRRTTSKRLHIYRIGIKIPPTWPEEPPVWFAQLEAQFALANINQNYTKYFLYFTAQRSCNYKYINIGILLVLMSHTQLSE